MTRFNRSTTDDDIYIRHKVTRKTGKNNPYLSSNLYVVKHMPLLVKVEA